MKKNSDTYKIKSTLSNDDEEVKISKEDLETLQNLSNFKKFLNRYIKRNNHFVYAKIGLATATWALVAVYISKWMFVSATRTAIDAGFLTASSVKFNSDLSALKKERDKLEENITQKELDVLINITSHVLDNNYKTLDEIDLDIFKIKLKIEMEF
ncbi:hypothetical protein [Mycoplasma sp. HU2014]|uniref:hypothetical protein n=1 Tax=Mycoplasma sp. HU2014 TaxID=1664275 RepID=UPI00067E091B|nr:hypothetical protein [Mycoplasma sp. HU2014]